MTIGSFIDRQKELDSIYEKVLREKIMLESLGAAIEQNKGSIARCPECGKINCTAFLL